MARGARVRDAGRPARRRRRPGGRDAGAGPVSVDEVLASVPLLAMLPADELDHLAALAEPFTLAAGETLFEEGEPAEALYIVATGLVESRKRLPGGRAVTATEQGPGSMFGEMAIIAGMPRIVGVTAVQDTTG